MECCVVPEGQFMWKQIPPNKVTDMLSFSAKNPAQRLKSIQEGLTTLAYGQSEYLRVLKNDIFANTSTLTKSTRSLACTYRRLT